MIKYSCKKDKKRKKGEKTMYNFNGKRNISFKEVKHSMIAMIFDIIGQATNEAEEGNFIGISEDGDEYGSKWLKNWADDVEEISTAAEDPQGLKFIRDYCSNMGWDFEKIE